MSQKARTTEQEPEFKKFDDAVRRILSVSRPELKVREEEWKREKAKKKRAIS